MGSKSNNNNNNNDSNWYASRKEIEENSPSRRDGVSLKKETNLRKLCSYFLKELGRLLRVPQITICTAVVYCQRFFTRQSHAKNDCLTIATVCMFLAGKAEETPAPLEKVIYISYKMRHKSDPSALERIKKKEVYEPQKDLILSGEKLVLSTLGFDLRVENPYVPLSIALKKFNYAQDPLARVAWNILNDGLCTSLCLQYKAQHIAAGAIFLSAKFAKVKLPSSAEEPWWHAFDVTPCQLEDISNQVMELYDCSRLAASGVAGSSGGGADQSKITPSICGDNAITVDSFLVIKGAQVHDDQIHTKNQNNENMGADSKLQGQAVVDCVKEFFVNETEPNVRCRETAEEVYNVDAVSTEKGEDTEALEWKNESLLSTSGCGGSQNFNSGEALKPGIQANIDEDGLRDAVVGSSTSCCRREDRCNQ